MSAEYEQVIAAAALQKPSRLVEFESLSIESFRDPNARRLVAIAREYRERHGGRNGLDVALATSILERSPSPKARGLLSFVQELGGLAEVTDPEFRDALTRVGGAYRRAVLKEHAAEAVEASLRDDPDAARAAMRRGLVEAEEVDEDRPTDLGSEGILTEVKELLRPKPESVRGSFDIGLPFLMERASFRRGDLTIVGGFAKDGKTQLATSMILSATNAGARILYCSLEMDREEMLALLIAKHASTIDPKGVRWAKILEGKATREERALFARAALDFVRRGKKSDDPDVGAIETPGGGTIVRWCPRRRPTLGSFCERVRAMADVEELDGAVGDYLELFHPDRRSGQHRLDLTEMCYQAKELALDGGLGRGEERRKLWVTMLHQISRAGRDSAEKRAPRHYVMRDLGESAGVERAANQIPWIYSDEILRNERRARVGMAAARRGPPLIKGVEVFFDPERAVLAPISEDP